MGNRSLIALFGAAAIAFAPVADAGILSFAKKHPVATAALVAGVAAMHCNHVNAGADYLGEGKQKRCLAVPGKAQNDDDDSDVVSTEKSASELARDRRQLVRNLSNDAVANGEPPEPPEGCEAHHIVPLAENRKGLSDYAQRARDAINGCIDINSAENGVYLPARRDGTSQCPGRYHKTLHTKEYYEDISTRLREAKRNGGCRMVREVLSEIKQELMR